MDPSLSATYEDMNADGASQSPSLAKAELSADGDERKQDTSASSKNMAADVKAATGGYAVPPLARTDNWIERQQTSSDLSSLRDPETRPPEMKESSIWKVREGKKSDFPQPLVESPAKQKKRRTCCGSCTAAMCQPREWPRCLANMFINHPKSYVLSTSNAFGWPILLYLLSNYLCVKGFVATAASKAALPYFKDYLQLPAERYQQAFLVFRQTPGCIKGVVGALSDTYAWMGYHKRSYIIVSAITGFLSCIALSVTPPAGISSGVVVLLFFLIFYQMCNSDILCEGRYTELMAEKPETGSAISTWVWLSVFAGSILSSVLVGLVSDKLDIRIVFAVVALMSGQQIFVTAWPFRWKSDKGGLLGEEYIEPGKRSQRNKIRANPGVFTCAMIVTLLASGSIVAGISNNYLVSAIYAVTASVGVVVAIYFLLPRKVAIPICYLFLSCALCPNVAGQTEFFLTADHNCVPGGPAFSYTYYITVTSICAGIFGFLGVVLFQRFVSKWTFRRALWLTAVVRIIASTSDCILVLRWNVTYLHIPDTVWYIFGHSMVEPILDMLNFLPVVVLISRLCPKSLESTVYAIVSGAHNFGLVAAGYIGNALAVYAFRIRTQPDKNGTCDFSNLPLAVCVCSILFPVIPTLMTFCMVPDKKMNVQLANDGDFGTGHPRSNDLDRENGVQAPSKVGLHPIEAGKSTVERTNSEEETVRQTTDHTSDTEDPEITTLPACSHPYEMKLCVS